MSLPWEKSVTVPAEAIQLEAREAQNKAARAALEKALEAFNPLHAEALCDYCQEFSGWRLYEIKGLIREAIAQLKGVA